MATDASILPARPPKSRRLVASNACEACRVKHVRCVSLPGDGQCQRCLEQNLTCYRGSDRRRTRRPSGSATLDDALLACKSVSMDRSYRENNNNNNSNNNDIGLEITGGDNTSLDLADFHRLTLDERRHLQRCLSAYRQGVGFVPEQSTSPSDPGTSSAFGHPRSYAAITSLASTGWPQNSQSKAHDTNSQSAQDGTFEDAAISPGILNNAHPSKMDCIFAWAKNIEILPLGTDLRTAADLLNLYFLRHYIVWPCLSRVLFYSSFTQQGPYCTPLLLNAILALGACFSSSPLIRGQNGCTSAANPFFLRAKQLLLAEIDCPDSLTVQALTILAQREGLCGRKASQSHYITTAVQLAVDMKLHLRSDDLDLEAAYNRSCTFWGLWCSTQEYSSLTGQPSPFHDLQTTCPYPPQWDLEAFDWHAAFERGDMVIAVPGSAPSSPNDAFAMTLLYANGIGEIFFSAGNRTIASQLECLRVHTGHLISSINRLPVEVAALFPSDIGTKILYHGVCILANRPFCNLPADLSVDHLPHPRHVCRNAADEIVRLCGILHHLPEGGPLAFLDCHVHTLLSAASVVLAESPSGESATQQESQLATILACLHSLAPYRPLAQMAIVNFQTLCSSLAIEGNMREEARLQARQLERLDGIRQDSLQDQPEERDSQVRDPLANQDMSKSDNISAGPLSASLDGNIGIFDSHWSSGHNGGPSAFASADGVNDMNLNLNYLDTYLALFQQDL